MLTVKATGSFADVIRDAREIHGRVVPYAAATALTRTASLAAKKELPAEMRRVFEGPTAYTLNSLFMVPATKDRLVARVNVKDSAAGGIAPEKYLQPEVSGGSRGEKRFERALEAAGLLMPNEWVIPGRRMTLDANGNITGARARAILQSLTAGPIRTRGHAARNRLPFVEKIKGTRGIWQREGRRLNLLFLFTSTAPQYARRLDFAGTVERTAEANLKPEFDKALTALLSRNR